MKRTLVILGLLFVSGCGKDSEPETKPGDIITGNFLANYITCSGSIASPEIRALFETPNRLKLQVSGVNGSSTGTARQIREMPGCTITNDSAVGIVTPGERTQYRALVTTGGVYSCSPAQCDSLCDTSIATTRIEYDLIFDGQNMDLYSEDTDPLCTRILSNYSLTY